MIESFPLAELRQSRVFSRQCQEENEPQEETIEAKTG